MAATSVSIPDVRAIRDWYPTLTDDFVYLENAGGSQVPGCVPEAIADYMRSCYVQVGAVYPASCRATDVVAEAHRFIEQYVGAGASGKVVLGASSTALIHLVANAYGEILQPGDEIVVAETNHEANATPWARLERFGVVVRIWHVNPATFECSLDELRELLNERTKIVAFPQVSNLLGEIVDVPEITRIVHAAGAKVFVDGVAYAPHGFIDVERWGVDWYVYSNYKVYGPHMASLYGRHDAFAELTGPNHYFIPREALPGKWELGALNHEGCAGLLALRPYLRFLAGRNEDSRATIEAACATMCALEAPLTSRLIEYLERKDGVRIIGPGSRRPAVGTISFVSDRVRSAELPVELAQRGIGIRAGHMYAMRLCEALQIDPSDGVVRISLLHYNTMEEIERTIEALDQVLG
jgi:cysteine desulfurase family protein (TIGR01976 family)